MTFKIDIILYHIILYNMSEQICSDAISVRFTVSPSNGLPQGAIGCICRIMSSFFAGAPGKGK